MASFGVYDLPPLRRGDTLVGFQIAELTETGSGDPIEITSARMQLRTRQGEEIYAWSTEQGNMTLDGGPPTNRLTLADVAPTETANFPVAFLNYDLETTLGNGDTVTYLQGTLQVLEDYTI